MAMELCGGGGSVEILAASEEKIGRDVERIGETAEVLEGGFPRSRLEMGNCRHLKARTFGEFALRETAPFSCGSQACRKDIA